MEYALIKMVTDYADEFDVSGFTVMEKSDWDDTVKKLKASDKSSDEIYFGTNEYLEFDSGDEFLEELDVKIITQNQYETLQLLFNDEDEGTVDMDESPEFGEGDVIDRIIEAFIGEDEDDD